jgi:Arc/MetJ family transcription regulator
MRTTIHLPDELIARAKQKAAERRSTLTAVIEEALREALARKPSRRGKASRTRLPTFRGNGLLPGVDLNDSAALLDRMDAAD